MTSGTLIELVEIGPRLSGLWVLPDNNHDLNGNYSTKILRDYIEISSNLYRQLIAWSEMEVQHKTVYATKLIKTNEHLAFRCPQSTTKEIIKRCFKKYAYPGKNPYFYLIECKFNGKNYIHG